MGSSSSDRGVRALEYLGIVVVAVIPVGALVTAIGQSRVGEQNVCHLRSVADQEARDCSAQVDPLYYDASAGNSGQDDFSAETNDRTPGGIF